MIVPRLTRSVPRRPSVRRTVGSKARRMSSSTEHKQERPQQVVLSNDRQRDAMIRRAVRNTTGLLAYHTK